MALYRAMLKYFMVHFNYMFIKVKSTGTAPFKLHL